MTKKWVSLEHALLHFIMPLTGEKLHEYMDILFWSKLLW